MFAGVEEVLGVAKSRVWPTSHTLDFRGCVPPVFQHKIGSRSWRGVSVKNKLPTLLGFLSRRFLLWRYERTKAFCCLFFTQL